jgi:hypothetical protein
VVLNAVWVKTPFKPTNTPLLLLLFTSIFAPVFWQMDSA